MKYLHFHSVKHYFVIITERLLAVFIFLSGNFIELSDSRGFLVDPLMSSQDPLYSVSLTII